MSQAPLIIDPPAAADACVIWLHGLGADRFDFVPVVEALNLPAGHGIRFVFPQAPTRRVTINNGFPMPCWYDILGMSPARIINDVHMGESSATVRQLVDAQISQGIPEQRIILAGFSQGGAVVLHAMLEGELRLGGLLALSTYGPTVAELVGRQGADAPRLDLFFAHGRTDDVLPISMGREAHDQLQAAGHRTEWHEYPMGHEVCPTEVSDIREWLTKRLSQ